MGKLPCPIPPAVYRKVEHRLRHREQLLREALEALASAEADAGAIASPAAGRIGGSGGVSDQTASRAVRITEARRRVVLAKKWIWVHEETEEAFRGTDAGRAVRLIFDQGRTQADAARAIRCDRQTIRRYKDDYIIRAAFLAVSAGLIRLRKGDDLLDPNGDHRQSDAGS